MSIVEAFSVGTPVICSDIGNAGSVVIEGITGTKFESSSVDKMEQAVHRLQTYPEIYKTTFKEYCDNYTKQQNYQQLRNIYGDLR